MARTAEPLRERFSEGTAFSIKAGLLAFLGTLLIGLWFLSYQSASLATPEFASNFYDEQVRSWFDGRWSMPADVLGPEGLRTSGGLQMYFGPFPSLLRVPILLVTDRFDGRLTQPSMLAAFVVYLGAVQWTWWQVWRLVNPDRAVSRWDGVLGAAATVMAGVGSVFLVVLTSATVYHEAIAWGVALAVLAFAALTSCLVAYSTRKALLFLAATACTLLSRPSVGFGAVFAAWAAVAIWALWYGASRRSSWNESTLRRALLAVAPTLARTNVTLGQCCLWLTGATVATGAYLYVNFARFGPTLSIPWSSYVFTDLSSRRVEALAANGNSLVGLRFAPTTLLAYLRPDAIDVDSLRPWLIFPRVEPTRVGDVTLDVISPSSSLTVTMPLLLVLAVLGLFITMRPPHDVAPSIGAYRLPLFSSLICAVPMFLSSFLAHRYMADTLPFLIMSGIIGAHVVIHRGRLVSSRVHRALYMSAIAALATWGVLVNFALSVEYQHLIFARSEEVRYDFVVEQVSGNDVDVARADRVPEAGRRGELLALGDCQALLWSSGEQWIVLEGSVPAEVWSPSPEDRFFDHLVTDPTDGRETSLCRNLLSDDAP